MADNPVGIPAPFRASGYKEKEATRQEMGTVNDVKLAWRDTEGPHKDGDLISRTEYGLPAPNAEGQGTTILIVISRESREDDDQVYCRLKLKEVAGPGYRSETFTSTQAAKRAAEKFMAGLTRQALEAEA